MNMPFNPDLFDRSRLNLSPAERLAETLCVIELKATDDTVTVVIEFETGCRVHIEATFNGDHADPYVRYLHAYIPVWKNDNINRLCVDLADDAEGIALAIERKLASDHQGRSVSAEEAFGGAL